MAVKKKTNSLKACCWSTIRNWKLWRHDVHLVCKNLDLETSR